MITTTPKDFKPNTKVVNYLNRDFSQLRNALVEFTKAYFPNTNRDFSEASPGMMFVEMAAYVGDVLAYYTDYQFQESLIQAATERKNLIALARSMGYKPRAATPAQTMIDLYILVPSKTDPTNPSQKVPDLKYADTLNEGMLASTSDGVSFRTLYPVDFSVNTPEDPAEITVYQRDQFGQAQQYLIKKSVLAIAGQQTTKDFIVGDAQAFYHIQLPESNVIEILNVVDTDGNRWYEVDYLAQELVPFSEPNTNIYNAFTNQYRNSVPHLLKFVRTSNRFVTGIRDDNTTYLEFGAGTDGFDDELIVPNLNTVGRGLDNINKIDISYDPTNFLKTRTYGKAPSNTTLTVTYTIGGGVASNVNVDTITNIDSAVFSTDISSLNYAEQKTLQGVRESLRVNNSSPATGGKDADTNDEIRMNAMANFGSQNRAVTKEDYVVRCLSMPRIFGTISKAYVVPDNSLNGAQGELLPSGFNRPDTTRPNPFEINLYTLSYNGNKNLIAPNEALKLNIQNYLSQYRMLTDKVNIYPGYVINIGVNFEISVLRGYNKKDVLAQAIQTIQNFFNIDNMDFNQPINLSRLQLEIAKVEGVQSVNSLTIKNLTARDGDYSVYEYDIGKATADNIIYPSLDPSVFEVKYLNRDIVGQVI
jgi:hypothetical protein